MVVLEIIQGLGFQGCVLIMDEITGQLKAVINANNLTAFRTALASSLGLTKLIAPSNANILPELSAFGVGLQAYWHIKLALLLYEGKIKEVNILNRTLKNAETLADRLSKEFKTSSLTVSCIKMNYWDSFLMFKIVQLYLDVLQQRLQ